MKIYRQILLCMGFSLICGCSSSQVTVIERGEEYQKLETYRLHGHDRIESSQPQEGPNVTQPRRLKALPSNWQKPLSKSHLRLLRDYNLRQNNVKNDADKQDRNSRDLIVGIAAQGMLENPLDSEILLLGIRNSSKPQPRVQPVSAGELGRRPLPEQRKYNQLRNACRQRQELNSLVLKLLTSCGGKADDCYYDSTLARLQYELVGLSWKLNMESNALRGRK